MLQWLSSVINWSGNGKIVLICQKLNRCSILLQCHVVDTVALVFQKCQLIGWHDFSWYRVSLHFLGWLIRMLNQSCIALVVINLSTSMNCQREHNFFPLWKSFFFSPLDLTNISDFCFRFIDRGRLFAKQEVQTLQIGPGGLFFTGDQTGLLTVYTWLAD